MRVEVVSYAESGNRVRAIIRIVEGRLQIDFADAMSPRYREQLREEMEFLQRLAPQRGMVGDRAFLQWLPFCIRGSYLWARFVAKD